MIFRTIDDASAFSGRKISSVFSAFTGLKDIQFSFDTSYASGLETDIAELIALKQKLSGVTLTKENARLLMPNSNQSAIDFALKNDLVNLGVNDITAEYTHSQDELYFKNLAVGKSFKDCQTIISAYNQSIDTANGKTEDLIKGTSQSNLHLGQYLNSLNGAKASLGGYAVSLAKATAETLLLNAVTAAMNIGISLLVSAAVSKISELIVTSEELAEKASEVTVEYNKQKSTLESNKKEADKLIDEYSKLSVGVNALGENASLTTDEYERFKELAITLNDLFPGLTENFANQGGVIERCAQNAKAATEAYEDMAVAANNVILDGGGSVFGTFANFYKGRNPGKLRNPFSLALTDDDIDILEDLFAAEEADLDNLIKENSEHISRISRGLEDRLAEHGGEWSPGESDEDQLKKILTDKTWRPFVASIIEDYEKEEEAQVEGVRELASAYVDNLLLAKDPDTGERLYNGLSEGVVEIIKNIVPNMGYDDFAQFEDAYEMYDHLSRLVESLSQMDEQASGAFGAYLDVKTRYNNKECTTGDLINELITVQSAINGIENEELKKQITMSLGVEGVDQTIAQYGELVAFLKNGGVDQESAAGFVAGLQAEDYATAVKFGEYYSKDRIERELEALGEGGNVDLLNRKLISAEELNKRGYEAGEGMATVFTETFSNEAGDIAVNFTPILKNGDIAFDKLEDFREYCESVIAGEQEDNYNLKIGATFEGDDAIAQAEAAAKQIHLYHQYYYANFSEYTEEQLLQMIREWNSAMAAQEPVTFNSLFTGENGLSEKLDKDLGKINTLVEAANSFRLGEFDEAAQLELMNEFPEFIEVLAEGGDVLDWINDKIAEYVGTEQELADGTKETTGILKLFSDAIAKAGDPETEAQLTALRDSVLQIAAVSAEGLTLDIDVEKSSLDAVVTALEEARSETGLTEESVKALSARYKGLEGFDQLTLFESTNTGLYLDEDMFRVLEEEYKKNRIGEISERLEELRKQLEETGDQDKAEQANLKKQINHLERLQSQYVGLTSAYNRWIQAQSAGTRHDSYGSVVTGKESVQEMIDQGWAKSEPVLSYLGLVTNNSIEALRGMTADQIVEIFNDLDKNIEGTKFSIADFFTFDDDGNVVSEGINSFFEAVRQRYSGDESIITAEGLNLTAENLERIANDFGMSLEAVELILKAAPDAGWIVDITSHWTGYSNAIQQAAKDTEKAKEKLAEGSFTEINLEINSDEIDAELGKAQAEFNKAAEAGNEDLVKYYENAIATLVGKKNQQSFELIDITALDSEVAKGVSLLLKWKDARNAYETAELTNDTAGRDSAGEQMGEIVSEMNNLPDKVKIAIGFEEKEEAPAFLSRLQKGEVDVVANLNVNASKGAQDVTEGISGIPERTEPVVDVVVKGMDDVTSLTNKLDNLSKYDGMTIGVNAATGSASSSSSSKKKGGKVGGSSTTVSAMASGTAYARGSWGAGANGSALAGELGPETLVRNGNWYILGEHGAEFFNYKKNDIIFNHKQTEELFKTGRATSGGGRGKAFAGGLSWGSTLADWFIKGSNQKDKTNKSGKKSGSGSGSKSASSDKDNKEVFDWIEVAIDRIERSIDRLDLKASSAFRVWGERTSNLRKQMATVTDEIELQKKAYDRYIQEANRVGLDAHHAKLVRDGAIDIETVRDEKLAEKIKDYQQWYKNALLSGDR